MDNIITNKRRVLFEKDNRVSKLEIYSDNSSVSRMLNELFKLDINIIFNKKVIFQNLHFETKTLMRELLKHNDLFFKLEIDTKLGVYNITSLPTNEVQVKELFDGTGNLENNFLWDGQKFENWQIIHFASDMGFGIEYMIIHQLKKIAKIHLFVVDYQTELDNFTICF